MLSAAAAAVRAAAAFKTFKKNAKALLDNYFLCF